MLKVFRAKIKTMNPLSNLWFWLLIISLLLMMMAMIAYESTYTSTGTISKWVKITGWIGIGIFFISCVLFVISSTVESFYNDRRNPKFKSIKITPESEKSLESPKSEDCDEVKPLSPRVNPSIKTTPRNLLEKD